MLEIGTGSGYQAAVLAEIVDKVYTIEIIKELADSAKKRLQALESRQHKQGKKGFLSQITLLAAIIAGAWIIVTLLNLLK